MRTYADERASTSGCRAKGWGRTALAACAALAAASCVPVVGRGVGREPVHIDARPVAALVGADLTDGPEDREGPLPLDAVAPLLPAGIGVRAGYATYPVTSDQEVDSRLAMGVYFHFAEKETRRFEGSVSFAGDGTDTSENRAYVVGINYVRYVGAQGFFYWSVGGGAISEALYADDYFFGYLEASTGYWIGSGQRGIDLRAGIQAPLGSDTNVNLVVFFAIGYDI
jgi:hypothetical protein